VANVDNQKITDSVIFWFNFTSPLSPYYGQCPL